MGLKVLQATVIEEGISKNFQIPGPGLLHFIDNLVTGSNPGYYHGAGQSKDNPISGMSSVSDWRKAANTLKGTPEQWIKLAGVDVVKTENSYYMNAVGLESPGVTERGGPSYNELAGLLGSMNRSDGDIASGVRALLSNGLTGVGESYKPLVCLTAAMFLAEPKRNPRSLPINLMLLDFIQNNVKYGTGDKEFSWENILWRSGFGRYGQSETKTYTFSDNVNETLKVHQRGGKLPMSNTDAVEQSQSAIPPAVPPANTAVYFPNSEMDKECTIVVRWLANFLNAVFKGGTRQVQAGATAEERIRSTATRSVNFSVAFQGLKAVPGNQFSYLNINSSCDDRTHEGILRQRIQGALRERFRILGCVKQ